MKLPPLMLGAVLLFWGWEIDLPTVGGILAVIIEGTRLIRARWEISDEDYNRVWNFCALLFIAAAVYAFTANQGPAAISRMMDDPGLASQRAAGESTQKTAASLLQWMPMLFFPFVVALALGHRETVKLLVFSLIARRRKQRRESSLLADRQVHADWIYFGICLVSASINNSEGNTFFLGLAVLVTWALWTRRSRRFALALWLVVVAGACGLGFLGQKQLGELRRFVENFAPQIAWRWGGRRTDPGLTRTDLGQVGRMKLSGTIAVRVEMMDGTPPPPLLRTASYRSFRNTQWSAFGFRAEGRPDGPSPGEGRPEPPPMRNSFGAVQPEAKTGSWVFRQAITPMRIKVSTYVDEAGENGDPLPVPMGFARFEDFPVATIKTNHLGVVTAAGTKIAIFDVRYGFNGSIDSPPGPRDLDVLPAERDALDRVIADLDLAGKTTNQIIRTVSSYFQDKFQYSLWQKTRYGRGTNTPLSDFLAPTNRSGHCEYFATATTLLLRRLGIPTRYAVGWSVQEIKGTSAIIRERHAHAWCLYYYNDQWHDLDTTPASWVAEENKSASMFQFLGDAWSRLKFEFFKWQAGQSTLRDYIWWIVGPMLLFLLYRLVRRKGGRRSRLKAEAEAQALVRLGLDSEFYLVEKKLAEFGFIRPAGETLGEFLQRAVRDSRVTALRDALQWLLRVHYRLRFDPLGLPEAEREALRVRVRDTLNQLNAARRA